MITIEERAKVSRISFNGRIGAEDIFVFVKGHENELGHRNCIYDYRSCSLALNLDEWIRLMERVRRRCGHGKKVALIGNKKNYNLLHAVTHQANKRLLKEYRIWPNDETAMNWILRSREAEAAQVVENENLFRIISALENYGVNVEDMLERFNNDMNELLSIEAARVHCGYSNTVNKRATSNKLDG